VTARLTGLRIAGFKSFAEPASVNILPGLTGVVGPNGCGKSNVVEALRWAMGETSAKSLRGGEMDDVIFAGTTARYGRNMAEVTITLEGTASDPLPEPWEKEAELQVTRRIERGAGSSFSANGREIRARDAQTLFADLASGARSSGMVSQGRVASLVNAQPTERRMVLEEAANITGLRSRRHEAELKLNAAEQNLGRAEDLRQQLDAAREALRKQARQAARYRNISGLVRSAESEHLAILHGMAEAELAVVNEADRIARSALDDASAAATHAQEVTAAAEEAIAAPRVAEADARSLLERRRVEAENLAADARRAAESAFVATQRAAEFATDLGDARRALEDAGVNAARLLAEAETLGSLLAEGPGQLAKLKAAGQAAAADVARDEAAADAAGLAAATAASVSERATSDVKASAARLAAATAEHTTAREALAELTSGAVDPLSLEDAARAAAAAEEALVPARAAYSAAETDRAIKSSEKNSAAARAGAAKRAFEEATAARAAAAATLKTAAAESARCQVLLAEADARRGGREEIAAAAALVEKSEIAAVRAEELFEEAERAASAAAIVFADLQRAVRDREAAVLRAVAARDASAARLTRAGADLDAAGAALHAARLACVPEDEIRLSKETAETAHLLTETAEVKATSLREAHALLLNLFSAAQTEAAAANADMLRLDAETAGLAAALGGEEAPATGFAIPAGLEAAVGAVLGDSAIAGLEPGEGRYWVTLPGDQNLRPPAGLRPLTETGIFPRQIIRALAGTGILKDPEDGPALQAVMVPGQAAVTADGAAWLWNGHVIPPGAHNPAAVFLAQTARLGELRKALEVAGEIAKAATGNLVSATAAEADASTAVAEAWQIAASLAAKARNADESYDALSQRAAVALAAYERAAVAYANATAAHSEAEAAFSEDSKAVEISGERSVDLEDAAGDHRDKSEVLNKSREARTNERSALTSAREIHRALASATQAAEVSYQALTPVTGRAKLAEEAAGQALQEAVRTLSALPEYETLDAELDEAAAAERVAVALEAEARERRDNAEKLVDATRTALSALQNNAARSAGEIAAASARTEAAMQALMAAARDDRAAVEALARLPDTDDLNVAAQLAREALAASRTAMAGAMAAHGALDASVSAARERLVSCTADHIAWSSRLAEADKRVASLMERLAQAEKEVSALSGEPARLEARAAASGEVLSEAEKAHASALAALAAAEGALRKASQNQREADMALTACSVTAARTEAACEAAAMAVRNVLLRAVERLGEDGELPIPEEITQAAEEKARRKSERLTRERDEMGPVNLRAEIEVAELDEKIGTLDKDRGELTTAIAKLRGSIGNFNRESRERLRAVFLEVDAHFRSLFTTTMGGGKAHLEMTGSDDPLEAGLEIFAEPPGKKLSSLALLSGGEQALTALCLIFSVFRCNPAPVAVLDEVDAPLDDANVDRFCTLLEGVAKETSTRFLVVTHHQVTMARMDRLYGVTMQERGVSRLLSVSLSGAEKIVGVS
jgi:chromosome segregation protein